MNKKQKTEDTSLSTQQKFVPVRRSPLKSELLLCECGEDHRVPVPKKINKLEDIRHLEELQLDDPNEWNWGEGHFIVDLDNLN